MLTWSAGFGSDPLGAWGPAFAVGFGYRPSLLELGVRLDATLPRTSNLPAHSGDVRSSSFGARFDVCAVPTLGAFQLLGCARGGATLLLAEGQGTARDGNAKIPLYGVGPSVGARWLLGRHAFVSVGAGASWFLKRPELLVDGLLQRRRIDAMMLGVELAGGVRW